MKKVISLFMSLVILISVTAGLNLTVFAEELSGSCGENVTYTLNTDTGLLTISGTGPMMECEDFEEYPWALNQDSIKAIEIANGVTSIGNGAFEYCHNLTSVIMGNSVTSIGEGAFYYCSSLTSITIPNSVASIGDFALSRCNSLTSVTIPNSVTWIGDFAFAGCDNLTSVAIPSGAVLGYGTFWYCVSLTSVTVDSDNPYYSSKDGVLFNKDKTELIQYPVGNMRTSYIIPNSVTSIGESAFQYCSSLTSVTIPNSVTSIDMRAFDGCSSLTSIILPSNLTRLGDYAFSRCSSLTSVTIPDNITIIGDYAFWLCNGLTSIVLPISITRIGEGSFHDCGSLTDIYYAGTQHEWDTINIEILNDTIDNVVIHCSDGIINEKAQVHNDSAPTQTAIQDFSKNLKATSIKKLTKGKKSFKATWKKITGVNGYQIQYSTDKKFKKNTKTVTIKKNTASTTIKKLKANKKYYVRVRSYKNAKVNGKTVKAYSSWSKVKSVKTK